MPPGDATKKRPIETITLDDSDDEQDQPPRPLSPPPRHRSSAPIAGTSSQTALGLTEEEAFERELQEAIIASISQQEASTSALPTTHSREIKGETVVPSGMGMDRAEMERERLERIAKRTYSSTSSTLAGGPTSSTPAGASSHSIHKRPRIATLADLDSEEPTSSSFSRPTANSFATSSSSSSTDPKSQRFFDGAIRSVSNSFHPDPESSHSLSFSSIIGPRSTLLASIVSAFVLDPSWVVPHFPNDFPLLLIMPRPIGDTDPKPLTQVSMGGKTNLFRAIPESVPTGYSGYSGCMHTKLLVFFHETFCRIVIPTANMIEYDWSQIDNAFYVQDFPLLDETPKEENSPFENPSLTQFSKNFIQVVTKLGASKGFLKYFKPYDYSKSDQVRLVHSTQGKYTDGADFDKGGGLASLAKGVASMGFAPGGDWQVEGTGSSIGQYSPTWLIQFLASCSGIHPTSYFTRTDSRPSSKTPPTFRHEIPRRPGERLNPNSFPLKIVYPTHDEIAGSYLGVQGGGTIFCKKSDKNGWFSKSFPQELFWKGESKRDRVAAHTKMLLATHVVRTPSSTPPIYEGYVYVGSHNLTPSAWGSLQHPKYGEPQLAINNHELGVLVPIRADSKPEFEKKASEMVTYKRPLVRYSPTDRPWMQAEYPRLYPGMT
ncbi:hypothetical protein JCM16303_003171 [Sporobolomyces ruberrimus]